MKIKNTLIAVFISVFALGINAAEREHIKLDSKLGHGGQQTWMMMKASDAKGTGAEISSINFNTDTWAEAIVPGTVLTNLVEQKIYPEPYYGQNNYLKNNLIPDLSKAGHEFYTYWFRTKFEVPAQFEGRRIWLEPEGINYRAEIWVNGYLMGNMAGMFNNQPFEITDKVKAGEKAALAIRVYPVDIPGTSLPKSWGAIGEWHNGGDGWDKTSVSL